MYSVAISSDPISYITCEISVDFFFILRLYIDNYSMVPLRYKTHFPLFNFDTWSGAISQELSLDLFIFLMIYVNLSSTKT